MKQYYNEINELRFRKKLQKKCYLSGIRDLIDANKTNHTFAKVSLSLSSLFLSFESVFKSDSDASCSTVPVMLIDGVCEFS